MPIIYTLIIFPIEAGIKFFLELIQGVSDSYGIALLGVSIIISTCTLPIYNLAEKWQDHERLLQKRMAKKVAEFKAVLKGYELHACLSTLYRQYHYHPIFAIRSIFGLLIQIPFFIAAYNFLVNYTPLNGVSFLFINDLGKADGLLSFQGITLNVLPFLMTIINLASTLVYGKKISIRENLQLYSMALLFLVLLYNSPSGLLIYWISNNLYSLIKNFIYRLYSSDPAGHHSSSFLNNYLSQKSALISFLGSAMLIFLQIFIASPLALLASSSSEDFTNPFGFFLSKLVTTAIIVMVMVNVIYWFSSPVIRRLLAIIITLIALIGTLNTFIFTGNYGDMSNFYFEKPLDIPSTIIIYNYLIALMLTIVISFMLYHQKFHYVIQAIFLLLFSTLIFSIQNGYAYHAARVDIHTTKMLTLSKTGKNVVVIMSDRFIGGYIPDLLRLIPAVKSEFEGFTWYPHSLSSGHCTLAGLPSIMGGYEYDVAFVNKNRTDISNRQRLNETIRILPYNFNKAGFQTTLFEPPWYYYDHNQTDYLNNTNLIKLANKYVDPWLSEHKINLGEDDSLYKLMAFGLFRFSPLHFRKTIYDNGNWQVVDNRIQVVDNRKDAISYSASISQIISALNFYTVMDYLPRMTEVQDQIPDQFYFMINDLTHEPWCYNSNFEIDLSGTVTFPKDDIYEKLEHSLLAMQHFYGDGAQLKLIGKWLNKLKEQGVYDNTRIIIVSDHGRTLINPMFSRQYLHQKGQIDMPRFHNLLLVKDFNARGEIKTAQDFMTTSDVPWLAMDKIIEGYNPYTNKPISKPESSAAKLPFIVSDIHWRLDQHPANLFGVRESFTITGTDIFNLNNWQANE